MKSESNGHFDLKFNRKKLPGLIPKLLPTQGLGFFQRIWKASQRRDFTLAEDWKATIVNAHFARELNGTVVIPKKYQSEDLELDGASVPMPWLIGMLSFGVLRPLGIMLTASIIHDFAYKYGGLLYDTGEGMEPEFLEVRRDIVDKLFRNIIESVNGTPFWAFMAWCAVRLGWFGVKYNGEYFGGKFPLLALCILLLLIAAIASLMHMYGYEHVIVYGATFYFVMYVVRSFRK